MMRTTDEKAKRARDGAEDAVYKPVRGAKKPVRIESETPERGTKPAAKRTAKKETAPADKPAERRTPRKYEPLPKEDTPQQRRQKREKEHVAAIAKDRRRALSGRRKGDPDCTADRGI